MEILDQLHWSLEGVGQPEGLDGREGGPFSWVVQAG
jgi:hypothetical protein